MDICIIIGVIRAIARIRKARSRHRIVICTRIVSADRGRSNIKKITIAINTPSVGTIVARKIESDNAEITILSSNPSRAVEGAKGVCKNMKYNERIRALRENIGKNQTEIAKILGTSQSYYSEYELGKRELPIKHLIALCQYYQVSADWILGIKNKAPKREP